jgi:hypothetical protein
MNMGWSKESKMNEEKRVGEKKKKKGNPMDEWYE